MKSQQTVIRVLFLWSALLSATAASHAADLQDTRSNGEIVCSFAPSQSKMVMGASAAAGGAAATTAGVGTALGLTVGAD